MKYLAYCVFSWLRGDIVNLPLGIEERPVLVVSGAGLSAAVSALADCDLAPEVSRLITYEQVVEWFHRRQTVIPLRYGCLFEERSQIVRLLEERSGEYRWLLGELDGLVEMGIRVLVRSAGTQETSKALAPNPQPAKHCVSPGRAYLLSRNGHYASLEEGEATLNTIAKIIRDRLSGQFVRSREERTALSERASLFSLHFLVPQPSVESFSRTVRNFEETLPGKLLLSGPWPPYNFVGRHGGCTSQERTRLHR
jgi:hypothetical protein